MRKVHAVDWQLSGRLSGHAIADECPTCSASRTLSSSQRLVCKRGSLLQCLTMSPSSAAIRILASALLCLAANKDSTLRSLYDTRQWFQMRDAISKDGAAAFYQGAVACAFNDLPKCETKLNAIVKTDPKSDLAYEAHRLMASVYARDGLYRKVLSETDAMLAIKPGAEDAKNDRPMWAALSQFPDQLTTERRYTTLTLRDHAVPISINGHPVSFFFDTGAELSLMSQSEAKGLGLKVRDVETKTEVLTGARIPTRIADADSVILGNFTLKHVAFLVFPDDQPPFDLLPPGKRGILGIPVLTAFGRFSWASDWEFAIGPPRKQSATHSDLCFEDEVPVVQLDFNGSNLTFALDTGAEATDLYPSFATRFPQLIASAKKESHKLTGVGSSENVDAAVLPEADFQIGGFAVVLRPATVLLKHTTGESRIFDGNLGMDLLTQAHQAVIDFEAMTFTLQ